MESFSDHFFFLAPSQKERVLAFHLCMIGSDRPSWTQWFLLGATLPAVNVASGLPSRAYNQEWTFI